jgi:hypothetical protein
LKEEKIPWKRKKSAVPKKKEDQGKTAENLMTQITKYLNAEVARTEESTREEKDEGCKKIKIKKLVQVFVG